MPPRAKKGSVDSSEGTILSYLKEKNRPYSAIDIFNNLHGTVGKTTVTKVLNSLADNGEITKKVFGKSTVYVARQDLIDPPSKEELEEMDNQIADLKETLVSLKETQKTLASVQQGLSSSLTLEEALARITALRKQNDEATLKVGEIQSGARRVDPDLKKELDRKYDIALKEWKKRRKMCMEIVNMLCESTGQKPNALFEEVGMEKDPEDMK